jgi:hypothetical protein
MAPKGSCVRILLVSTANLRSGRDAQLLRLLESVAASGPAREGRLRHLLLCQRATSAEATAITARFGFVEAHAIPEQISLSQARNRLLFSPSGTSALEGDGIAAFPDDDAWYTPPFLEHALSTLARERAAFFFCRYASSPDHWDDEERFSPRPASLRKVISHASSNTIVVRTSLARVVGKFDESLGLGTNVGNGEDTDYAIRAFLASPRTIWIDAPLVGHRDSSRALRRHYFAGDLIVLARHARTSGSVVGPLLRKAAIGGYYAATGQMSVTEVVRASTVAVRTLFRGAPPS